MQKYGAREAKYFPIDGNFEKSIWKKAEEVILRDAVTGEEIKKYQAHAKMLWSDKGLFVLWQVDDEHIWGTYKKDDDPIYNEEVVEIFIGVGKIDAKKYFEFQFSPLGVKFDAKITNPTGNRHDKEFKVDIEWDCRGLKHVCVISSEVERSQNKSAPLLRQGYGGLTGSPSTFAKATVDKSARSGKWTTEAFIPWQSIGVKKAKSGDVFRANLFRIDGYPKQNSFQSWQPTLENPANFHVPKKFGYIILK